MDITGYLQLSPKPRTFADIALCNGLLPYLVILCNNNYLKIIAPLASKDCKMQQVLAAPANGRKLPRKSLN